MIRTILKTRASQKTNDQLVPSVRMMVKMWEDGGRNLSKSGLRKTMGFSMERDLGPVKQPRQRL